jgi:acyl-CoA synthetase (AMP-forming)/AMP-acid ligase II
VYRFDDVPASTTPAVLATVAAAHPDRPFIIGEDGALTYGQVAASVARTAAGLTQLGRVPGDRVGILLTNGVRWIVTYLAAHAAGLTVVPLNTWYREDELSAVAKRADLRLIVAQDKLFGQLSVAEQTGVPVLTWNPHADLGGFPQVADALSALRAAPVRRLTMRLFRSPAAAQPSPRPSGSPRKALSARRTQSASDRALWQRTGSGSAPRCSSFTAAQTRYRMR